MPPILLTIQTVSPAGGLALSDGEKLLAEVNLDIRKTATEWLLQSIEDLLARADSPATVAATLTLYGCFAFMRVGMSHSGNTPYPSRRPAMPAHLLKLRNTIRFSCRRTHAAKE